MSKHDVVVVGAGLAGLQAARCVVQAGKSVVVLEARGRVGGRTWSIPLGKGTFDVGGQWIGPSQDRVLAVASELGLETFPTHCAGRKVLEMNGKVSTYKGEIPSLSIRNLLELQLLITRMNRMARRVPLDAPQDARNAAQWGAMSVEDWKTRNTWGAGVAGMVDLLVRSILSCEPREVGFLYFLHYIHAAGGVDPLVKVEDGGQERRFVAGAQALSVRMAAELGERGILEAPVSRIEQTDERVRVHAGAARYQAERVIVALPPPSTATIDWQPALPAERRTLVEKMAMGHTFKYLATYDLSFWRGDGLSGEALSHTGDVVFAYDNTSHDGAQPCLVAFVTADRARHLAGQTAQARREAVLEDLARFFGDQALHPTDFVETDWNAEPWSGGGPVGVGRPGAFRHGAALRAPVGRVHWAGTETATRWCGFMDGAIRSGERAAREVLAAWREQA